MSYTRFVVVLTGFHLNGGIIHHYSLDILCMEWAQRNIIPLRLPFVLEIAPQKLRPAAPTFYRYAR
jgi:hypothetical protein